MRSTIPFLTPADPLLRKVAKAVPTSAIASPEVQKEIERMFQIAYGEQEDRQKPILVGLAAPQIGISKRTILVDVKANGKGDVGDLRVFINPEIIETSTEEVEWYEGCFSTDRVCGIVSRPVWIKLQAYNEQGNIVEHKYEGYTARIFQHEIDHLDGKEFTTHISDDDKLHWVEEDEFVQYRNHEAWRNWPKKCPREKLERIKGIRA